MLKDDDSLREASRVASHSASPGTIMFLAMKIPYPKKLLKPGKIRMVGHPNSKKGVEVTTRLRTSTVRLLLRSISQSMSQSQPRFKGVEKWTPCLDGKCSKHVLQRRMHTGMGGSLQPTTGKERKTTNSEVKVRLFCLLKNLYKGRKYRESHN